MVSARESWNRHERAEVPRRLAAAGVRVTAESRAAETRKLRAESRAAKDKINADFEAAQARRKR
jgi:hypothetical protein